MDSEAEAAEHGSRRQQARNRASVRSVGAMSSTEAPPRLLIHASAWKGYSPKFALTKGRATPGSPTLPAERRLWDPRVYAPPSTHPLQAERSS